MSNPSDEQASESSGSAQRPSALPARTGQRAAELQPRRPIPPKTLDGYQIPFPRPTLPSRYTPSPRAQKTSTIQLASKLSDGRISAGGSAHNTAPRTPSNLSPRPSAVKTGSPAASTSKYATPHSVPVPPRDYISASNSSRFAQKTVSRPQYGRASYPVTAKTASPSSSRQTARIQSQLSSPLQNAQRRHSMASSQSYTTPKKTTDVHVKTSLAVRPLWQQLDNQYEEELLRRNKRDRNGNVISFVKRIHSTARREHAAAVDAPDPIALDPDRVRAEIAPRLRLKIGGVEQESSDSNDDEPRYRPQARLVKRKSENMRSQFGVKKAARKVEYVNATSSESEESDDSQTKSDVSDESPDDQASDHDEAISEVPDQDVDMDEAPGLDVPDIILLDNPREISVPPPDPDVSDEHDEPLDDLIAAVEALSLPDVRMQKISRLPFLLRNLRLGFLKRCRTLQIPIFTAGRAVSLSVRYEYVAGSMYRTRVESWRCPLCNLLGAVKTQEMLDCHLRWDHPEVYHEWQKIRETDYQEFWELRLLIPEITQEDEDIKLEPEEPVIKRDTTPPADSRDATATLTPATRNAMSPFPFVALSPPSVRRDTTLSDVPTEDVDPFKLEPLPLPETDASITPSVRSTSNDLSSRARSTTGTTASLAPVPQSTPGRASSTLDPAPPPPDNPLGPAAQPPYLPAESDYGGPTVYYSCRPGGPCLFDLLGTLPMEPFGLLDWEVIDREEEIYESDDVKEEYKIMHALWARWIMLNRNKFISNYYKGVIAFVDQYWKIIHKTAGWDALRHWLFVLLANQFLDGREVAKVLVHYEGLTGMAHWYD